MLISALAFDYDGTLAHEGQVAEPTLEALKRAKASGRRLLIVTGRELPQLQEVFPALGLFDAVVAENGALLYRPGLAEEQPLAPAPPPAFVEALKRRGIAPLSVGRSIVATVQPHETQVLAAIEEAGLEWQIILNKGSVMCLPPGVNKASGLLFALDALGLSPLNVLGAGDAENDHAFLAACGLSAAVENALPALKAAADLVTEGADGAGVAWLIGRLLDGPPDALTAQVRRHDLLLGEAEDGTPFALSPERGATLIAGTSGMGKSKLATALIERIQAHGCQLCVIDPEGDYQDLDRVALIGEADRPPAIAEAMALLERPATSLVVNLLGLESGERPLAMAALMAALSASRAERGRPHWIVVDESHHVMPRAGQSSETASPKAMPAVILVTVEPQALSMAALEAVETVVAVGEGAAETIARFCEAIGEAPPPAAERAPGEAEVLAWRRGEAGAPRIVKVEGPRREHQRHVRKYAAGELGPDKSFYFKGPDGRLNLRAHNLTMFLQIGEGVDDETWLFHLKEHHYSRWFCDAIGDEDLAAEARQAEDETRDDAAASRAALRRLVTRRYTAPAQAG